MAKNFFAFRNFRFCFFDFFLINSDIELQEF